MQDRLEIWIVSDSICVIQDLYNTFCAQSFL